VLGELVRRVSGEGLDEFARRRIFEPLGMTETTFRPPELLCERAAPTEQRSGRWMQGEVHDPRAYELGGVAGHAGLFSTAADLAVFAQMLLDRGQYGGRRVMAEESVALMTGPHSVSSGTRGLGWDRKSPYSSNRSPQYSAGAFGHGGFTGTSMWIDPERGLFVIFLSNRLHPDGKGHVNPLAARIGIEEDRTEALLAVLPPGATIQFAPLELRYLGGRLVLPGREITQEEAYAAYARERERIGPREGVTWKDPLRA